MSENIDQLYDSLLQELESSETSGMRLDEIVLEHSRHDFECELCEYFLDSDEMIAIKVARHNNCLEKTLDKLIEWGDGRGDPGWEVDVLLAACSRRSFSGKWLDHVLDTAWIYRLQFERDLHFRFISNLMDSRELTENEISRIKESNEMNFNEQSFPSKEELKRMGF